MNNKVLKNGFSFILILILLYSLSITAFGIDGPKVSVPASDKNALSAVFKKLESDDNFKLSPKAGSNTGNGQLLQYDSASNNIILNEEDFKGATDKSRKTALSLFVKTLKDSGVSEQTQQNIFQGLGEADRDVSALLIPMIFDSTNADLYTAYKWVAPLLKVVRVILGLGTITIVLLLLGSTVIDLAYIGLPVAREAAASREGNGGEKPFGVSYDAVSAVKETESSLGEGGRYKNAYVIYFKRRAVTYIILSICILYLVVGEIGGLVGWLMSLASGVVQ